MQRLTDTAWRTVLPEYLALLTRGQRPGPEWAAFEAHTARSPECAAELAELRDLLDTLAAPDALPELPAPAPDLYFLPQQAHVRARTALSSLVIQLATNVLSALRGPQLSGMLRGIASAAQEHPAQDDAPAVLIEIDLPRNADTAVLRVTIGDSTLAERQGFIIILETPSGTLQAQTDDQGCAVLSVPAAELAALRLRFG